MTAPNTYLRVKAKAWAHKQVDSGCAENGCSAECLRVQRAHRLGRAIGRGEFRKQVLRYAAEHGADDEGAFACLIAIIEALEDPLFDWSTPAAKAHSG